MLARSSCLWKVRLASAPTPVAQSLADATLRCDLPLLLDGAGPVVCSALCFEITRTVVLANRGELTEAVDRMRGFGASGSRFGCLRPSRVDLIRVDGRFIKWMWLDPLDDAAVHGLLASARVLGVQ